MTKTIAYLVCSVSAVALAAQAASAQEASKPGQEARDAAPNPATSDGLSEIVVTAQHRSESLQKVPIAITAINAEARTPLIYAAICAKCSDDGQAAE